MTKEFIYKTLQQHQMAVLATVSAEDRPEAALIGFAVTNELEIVFDTAKTSRKYKNLSGRPRIALVIGWDNETTIQYEGEAVELGKTDNSAYTEAYYSVFPEGRQRAESWGDLTYFVIKPTWIRYSNFNDPGHIEEINF